MSRKCEFCGKKTTTGYRVARRGLAKYLGGVGRKITGRTKRTFKPNIQRVRAEFNGVIKRVKICTNCLRSGAIKKPSPRPKIERTVPVEPVPTEPAPIEPVPTPPEPVEIN